MILNLVGSSSIYTDMESQIILFVSDKMHLGGGSSSILNLCDGFSTPGLWTGMAAVTRECGFIGQQIKRKGHRLIGPNPKAVLHEERMETLYHACMEIQPKAVVAALGGDSFDFLRHVPNPVLRIAMIQSDDELVYRMVEKHSDWIDVIVGVSREICRRIETRIPNPERISYQPYGVPMPDCDSRHHQNNTLRVLYLGRVVEEQKRVSMMMRIMRTTLDAHHGIRWTIAGDGELLDALRSEFANDIPRVDILGALDYSKVPELLNQHDVYFLCSDYEGLPLSLLEAMGAGLVPVVSDLPSGISEVVHDGNGIKVPMENESEFVEALVHLASKPQLINEMGKQAALDVRREFSTAAMTTRWESMLNRHVPTVPPTWKSGFIATAPLDMLHSWKYHSSIRRLRKWIKSAHR